MRLNQVLVLIPRITSDIASQTDRCPTLFVATLIKLQIKYSNVLDILTTKKQIQISRFRDWMCLRMIVLNQGRGVWFPIDNFLNWSRLINKSWWITINVENNCFMVLEQSNLNPSNNNFQYVPSRTPKNTLKIFTTLLTGQYGGGVIREKNKSV